MADNGNTPAHPAPAPAPAGAVVAEPALAPLRKIPPKVVSPMDRLKAYLKEVPGIRARLVKVTEEQEEMLKRSKASIESFDHATARINDLVKSWEEQNAGQHAPVGAPAVAATPAAPAPAGEGAKSGG